MPGFSGVNKWVENIARSVQADFNIIICAQSGALLSEQEERVGNVTIVKIPVAKQLRYEKLPLYSAWNRGVSKYLKSLKGPLRVIAPFSGVESFTLDEIPGIKLYTLLVTDERSHRFPQMSRKELQDLSTLDPRTREVVRRESEILNAKNGRLIGDSSVIIKDLEELFDSQFANRSVVLPINLESDTCKPHNKQKIVFFVGRCDNRKGLRTLLDAWEWTSHLLPDWKLIVATSGGDDYETASRLSWWSAHQFNAEILWNVEESIKHLYMAKSSIVVVPSLYESFGLVALEALQHGSIAIVSDVGGLPEVIDAVGVRFNPLSSQDLAMKIALTARDEKLLRTYPSLGRTRVQESFSDEAIRNQVIQILFAADSSAMSF